MLGGCHWSHHKSNIPTTVHCAATLQMRSHSPAKSESSFVNKSSFIIRNLRTVAHTIIERYGFVTIFLFFFVSQLCFVSILLLAMFHFRSLHSSRNFSPPYPTHQTRTIKSINNSLKTYSLKRAIHSKVKHDWRGDSPRIYRGTETK